MEPQVQYVRSADGTSIAFFQMGDGAPLILSSNIWHHMTAHWEDNREASLQLIRDGFHLVRYDMRGMGMSDRDVTDFSLEAQVADLEALRQHLGFEQFALLGMVHASPACITYAAQYPERLTHLILVIPFAHGEVWYQTLPTLRGLESLRALGDEQWELYTLTHATALSAHDEEANPRREAAIMRECTTPETLRRYLAALRTHDVTPLLAAVRTPTLVISRAHGLVGVNFGRSVVQGIAQARLAVGEAGAGMPTFRDAALVTQFVLGQAAPARSPEVAPADLGTSGTAVILFADIADSAALTERLGDAAFRERARELDDALRRAITSNGGMAIDGKLLGDGVMATFGAAREAIACAAAIHAAGSNAGLPLHVGIHAGDVIRESNNVYGGAVNIAARVAGEAAAGETLVSGTVRDLARTSAGVSFEDRGDHELKGIDGPVRVFAVRAN